MFVDVHVSVCSLLAIIIILRILFINGRSFDGRNFLCRYFRFSVDVVFHFQNSTDTRTCVTE